MKSKWKLWMIPIIAVLAVGVIKGGVFQGNDKEIVPVSQMQTVKSEEVVTIKKQDTVDLNGDIEAVEEAIVSAKVAGMVNEIYMENGDLVSGGERLILLEGQDYQNQLTIYEALLKKAQKSLANAHADYERFSNLAESGAVTPKELEGIQLQMEVAEADVNSAEASVSLARESLDNTEVSAPISGVVANKDVVKGQVLSPGMPLVSIKDITSVYAVVNLKQEDMAKINKDMKAEIKVDAFPTKNFVGTVEIINPAAKASARVFETKIKINNPEGLLKPGMFAKVKITVGNPQAVAAVPMSALTGIEGMYFVFLLDGDTVKRQQVEIGATMDKFVEVKSGLKVGQKIAITNVNKLKDQDKVNVVD